MNKAELEKFLLKSRTQTYAAAKGKSNSLLPGTVQYDYNDGDFSYRDVYYIGNGIFPGLETVFFQDKPVWSMSYFGDFSKMTEEQADQMLRPALMDLWETTRIYHKVEKDYDNFSYKCAGEGTIDELSGTEEIYTRNEKLYFFTYMGGFIG
jgi:hypothetical protein